MNGVPLLIGKIRNPLPPFQRPSQRDVRVGDLATIQVMSDSYVLIVRTISASKKSAILEGAVLINGEWVASGGGRLRKARWNAEDESWREVGKPYFRITMGVAIDYRDRDR